MRISKIFFVFLLFVLLVFVSSLEVSAQSSCFDDFDQYIYRPDPTITVDFKEPVDYNTISVSFLRYPKIDDQEGSWDYLNPVNETSLLNEVSFLNESVIVYNLTEDLKDGERYSLSISADLLEEDIIITYYECEMYLVDFGALTIEKQFPANNFVSSTSTEMIFRTNRKASCFISTSDIRVERMTVPLSTTGGTTHRNIHPGSDVFYIGCIDEGNQITREEFNIVLDTTPPSSPKIEFGAVSDEFSNISNSRNSVRVRFTTSDVESGIDGVNFTIVEKSTDRPTMAWTSVKANEWVIVTSDELGTPIQLRDRGVYEILAFSANNAGLKSQESRSIPFEVYVGFDPDAVPEVDHCEENNVDCPDGHECTENLNCISNFCHPEDGVCSTPTCEDSIQNQDETDVDCGGSCSACENGDSCIRNSDCISNSCDIDTMTCVEAEKEAPPPPVDRTPTPPVQEDRNYIMPILVAVFAVVILGGGGYYGYMNKDKIMSSLGGGFGFNSSNSGSQTSQNKAQATASQFSQSAQQVQQNAPGSVVATQLSRRLKSKETKRKREDIFKGFSNSESAEKSNISKDDIDSLFDTKK